MPRPGESGVMRKPLSGEMGVSRRSWVSRGPVARPQAWGMLIAAARCNAAARPTPVSSEEVSTAPKPRAQACSIIERAAVIPPTLASLMTRMSTAPDSARVAADCAFSTDSSAAMGMGELRWSRERVGMSAGITGSSMNSGEYLARRCRAMEAWFSDQARLASKRSFMASPTALRVQARASSSMSRSRPPTLSFEGAKAFLDCFCCQNFRLGGGSLSDYCVDFNRSGRATKEDSEGLGIGLGKTVQCCGLKGEGERGWRNGGKWGRGKGSRKQGRGNGLEGGSEVSEGGGTAGERSRGFAEADNTLVGFEPDHQAVSGVD